MKLKRDDEKVSRLLPVGTNGTIIVEIVEISDGAYLCRGKEGGEWWVNPTSFSKINRNSRVAGFRNLIEVAQEMVDACDETGVSIDLEGSVENLRDVLRDVSGREK